MDMYEAAMIAEGACGYETNDEAKYLGAWQHLIDTGLCWQLQSWFGRTALILIADGFCTPPKGTKYEGGRLVAC